MAWPTSTWGWDTQKNSPAKDKAKEGSQIGERMANADSLINKGFVSCGFSNNLLRKLFTVKAMDCPCQRDNTTEHKKWVCSAEPFGVYAIYTREYSSW